MVTNPLPGGVTVVSRDWFEGEPAGDYAVCYVNAFQTEADDDDVDRPDERSSWPPDLVLSELGEDPNWGGEYLVDISTAERRERAGAWVGQMIRTCKDKGYEAVEFDNLDSWTRFDGTPLADQVPFGRAEAVAFATILSQQAHELGLAAAQKNTVELDSSTSRQVIGFDLAVVEDCGAAQEDGYDECEAYVDVFDEQLLIVEYTDRGFAAACKSVGGRVSVVRRDVDVTRPDDAAYRYEEC